VATRKRKKRSWAKTVLVYTTIPLTVWLIAFVLWFYWPEISAAFNFVNDQSRPAAKSNRSSAAPAKQPREKIFEEDRKKLEDILKRRG
jgi:hypothetical protein